MQGYVCEFLTTSYWGLGPGFVSENCELSASWRPATTTGASASERRSTRSLSLRMTSSGLETDVGEEGPALEQADEDETL